MKEPTQKQLHKYIEEAAYFHWLHRQKINQTGTTERDWIIGEFEISREFKTGTVLDEN